MDEDAGAKDDKEEEEEEDASGRAEAVVLGNRSDCVDEEAERGMGGEKDEMLGGDNKADMRVAWVCDSGRGRINCGETGRAKDATIEAERLAEPNNVAIGLEFSAACSRERSLELSVDGPTEFPCATGM